MNYPLYRPCRVGKYLCENGVFHGWAEISEIVPPSVTIGGHGGGVVKDIFAVVELEDGTLRKFPTEEIKFLDSDQLFNDLHYDGGCYPDEEE